MKWSEDGSEITLTAAEFSAQTAAMAIAIEKVNDAQTYAISCNDLLNEALNKDSNLRYLNDVKNSCDRKSVAQAEVISAARVFFATMMNSFGGLNHPEDCPCSVCHISSRRKALDGRGKKFYFGDTPQFTPVTHVPAHIEESK